MTSRPSQRPKPSPRRPSCAPEAARTWTLPWYDGTRTLRWFRDEQVLSVETQLAGRDATTERHTLPALLGGAHFADPATESEVLLAMSRGKPLRDARDHAAVAFRFWRAFDPGDVPLLSAVSPAPGEVTYRVFTAREGLRGHPVDSPQQETVWRWDGVYLQGPPRGGLPLTFRRELRRALRSALAEGARSLRAFPLLDYEKLPREEWSTGDRVVGSRARFEAGWVCWSGWDLSGRPEGGTMLYSVEHVFAGLHAHVGIPEGELDAIARAVTLHE